MKHYKKAQVSQSVKQINAPQTDNKQQISVVKTKIISEVHSQVRKSPPQSIR